MPIYEYVCDVCQTPFAHLWRSLKAAEAGELPVCPACASPQTHRILSQVAVLGSVGGLTPGEQAAQRTQENRAASFTPKEQLDKLRGGKKNNP